MTDSARRSVLLTGAGSYLGQQTIADLLSTTSLRLVAVGSPRLDTARCVPPSDRLRYLTEDLTKPSERLSDEVSRAEVVLHLAWVRDASAATAVDRNRLIIDRLLDNMADRAGFVFMSSVAASPTAHSSYGQAKFALAEHVAAAGGIVLTCGLVCAASPQGPYKQLIGAVDKLPVRVVPVGPPPNVYPIPLTDVMAGLRAACERKLAGGVYKLWRDVVPMHEFLASLPVRARAFRLPVPVPFALINPIVSLFRAVRLLPASIADQLKTFLYKDDEYLASLEQLPPVEAPAGNTSV